MAKWPLLLFLCSASCFAGQGIVLSTQSVTNASVPAQNSGSDFPYRVEWCMHDWSTDITGTFTMNPVGLYNYIYNDGHGDVRFSGYAYGESGGFFGGGFTIEIGTAILNGVPNLQSKYYVARFQHDPYTLSDIFQVWDSSGALYSTQKVLYGTYSYTTSNGVTLNAGGGTSGYQIDFFRIYKSTVPENYREPTSSDTTKNCVVMYEFDGNLNDSCNAGPYNGTISGGTPYYVNAPNQTLIQPVMHSSLFANTPLWDYEWPDEDASIRAGYPATLDGTLSYSMMDSSQIASYQWALLSGPSQPTWDSHFISTPTLNGIVYGDYQFQLTVKDTYGNVGTRIQHVGAVATDSKDIVISSNPNVGYIFGPQLRFGSPKNPWGYADERQQSGSEINNYGTPQHYWTWLTTGTGTTNWTWNGLGGYGAGPGTTLTSNISSFTLTVPIADKTKLDFNTFPTRIVVFGGNGAEEMRVCSKTDGTFPATTLNLCYDGRASGAYQYAFPQYQVTTATSANSGVVVGQNKVLGTNTLFISDPNTALCVSTPAPMGTMLSSGTVTMTAGTTTIVGVNTGWNENLNQYSQCTAPYNACVGDNIIIQGTHAGGTPFTFIANLTTFIDSTHMQVSRIYPQDADNGTFAFTILNSNRLPDLYYTRAFDGSQGQRMVSGTGCESNTDFYFVGQYDSTYEDGKSESGAYSYKTGVGLASQYSSNFYGSGMAHRNLALRSGLAQPLYRANVMDDYWCQDPEQDGGYAGGIPLLYGGGAWGCYIDAATNQNYPYSFAAMRGYPLGTSGVSSTIGCNADDSRDTGYGFGIDTLDYLYDTSSATWNTTINQTIVNMLNRDTMTVDGITGDVGCKHNDNSWSNGFLFNYNGPKVEVTNGTTTVNAHSGSTFNSSTCYDIAHGTITVTNSSDIIKGTGFPATSGYQQITITGTKGGSLYTLWTPYLQINSTTAYIEAMWIGDNSSTATYIIRGGAGNVGFATIAASPDDPLMKQNWSCYLNGPSSFTLQSPWTSATDTTGDLYLFDSFADASVSIAGYGQQPYMLGINMRRNEWLAHTPQSAYQAKALSLLGGASQWMYNVGFSTDVGAVSYGRVYQACEPIVPYGDTTNPYATWRNGGACQPQGWNISSLPNYRQLNTEGSTALRGYYDTSGSTSTAVAWADKLYGAIFGYCPWTSTGAFCDAYYAGPTSAMTNAALGSYKYFGQAFGVGDSSTWPAVREGAVDAQVNRTLNVGYHLPANATQAQILLTEPDGYMITNTCSGGVCPVVADARQGAHLMQIQYLNGGGAVVAQSDVMPQPVQ